MYFSNLIVISISIRPMVMYHALFWIQNTAVIADDTGHGTSTGSTVGISSSNKIDRQWEQFPNDLGCHTGCGASEWIIDDRTLLFEKSALRLASYECGHCIQGPPGSCKAPYAHIPHTGGSQTTDTCCQRMAGADCAEPQTFFLPAIISIFYASYWIARDIWYVIPYNWGIFCDFCHTYPILASLIGIIIVTLLYRHFKVPFVVPVRMNSGAVKKRLESWPPEGVTAQMIKDEPYASLILPPGSVQMKTTEAPQRTPPASPLARRRFNAKTHNTKTPSTTVTEHSLDDSNEQYVDVTPSPSSRKSQNSTSSSVGSYSGNNYPYEFIESYQQEFNNLSPVLFFVNTASGGQFGWTLLKTLKQLLHPAQIVHLNEWSPVKPKDALREFIKLFGPRLRIAIGGGDGTVGWILEMLDQLDDEGEIPMESYPPVSALPYGVGNDIARVLGYTAPFSSPEEIKKFLVCLMESRIIDLDRWEFHSEPLDPNNPKPKDSYSRLKKFREFNNYFGLGTDAAHVRGFQVLRENFPGLCISKVVNMFHYTWIGFVEMFLRPNKHLKENITLICDGVEVPLDDDLEGISVGNIASYASGLRLWHETDVSATELQQDGKLDVCALRGAEHIGLMLIGFAKSTNYAQASKLEIILKRTTVMHTDGEAWYQPPSRITIKKSTRLTGAKFLKRTNWAAEQKINTLLMKAEVNGVTNPEQTKWFQQHMSERMDHVERGERNTGLLTKMRRAFTN